MRDDVFSRDSVTDRIFYAVPTSAKRVARYFKHDRPINAADPVLTAAVRVALAQKGMDPLAAVLAGQAPAVGQARGPADWSDRDRSDVWKLS